MPINLFFAFKLLKKLLKKEIIETNTVAICPVRFPARPRQEYVVNISLLYESNYQLYSQ